MREVTHLLVIGWRANEDHFFRTWREVLDKHGIRPLPPKLARTLIVDQDTAGAEAVARRLTDQNVIPMGGAKTAAGFTSFMEDGSALEDFLG